MEMNVLGRKSTIKISDFMSKLISCNSVSSIDPNLDHGNLDIISLLANHLEGLGFRCEVMELADNKANLIATLGSGPGGLVLAGHTDTVPCDEQLWDSDPFILTERDNAWFGLGCCDMKSFFALSVEALKQHHGKNLRHPLIIIATADEESSMRGARALVAAGSPVARRAIIGEPTGMRPISMHKGIMIEKLTVTGRSGHSSNPNLGQNAMDIMHKIISQLLELRDRMRQQKHPGFEIDYPTLNLGCIRGGDNANRICGHCFLAFEIRPLPGMSINQLQFDLESEITKIAEADRAEWNLERLLVPPFQADENSEMVSLCEKLTGQKSGSVAFATEAPYFQELGMDVVVLGAGDIEAAHQPNEYLMMDRINPNIKFLSKLIGHCCL